MFESVISQVSCVYALRPFTPLLVILMLWSFLRLGVLAVSINTRLPNSLGTSCGNLGLGYRASCEDHFVEHEEDLAMEVSFQDSERSQ